MSTQQQTTGSNTSNLNFNPTAESAYNSLIGSGSNILSGYMNNPFGNASYQLGSAASQKGASQAGQNNMAMLQQLFKTSGMGGTAGQGFMGAQNAQMGRANQAMMSQANLGNIQGALGRQMAATGMGMSFSPQLTGQSGTSNSTTSMGGLGTWLPQLLGTAAGAAMGGMTGGASMAGGFMQPSYMPGGGPNVAAPTGNSGLPGTLPGSFGTPYSGFPSMSSLPNMMPSPMLGAMMGQQ